MRRKGAARTLWPSIPQWEKIHDDRSVPGTRPARRRGIAHRSRFRVGGPGRFPDARKLEYVQCLDHAHGQLERPRAQGRTPAIGTVLGKALGDLEHGSGTIKMLVMLR